MNEEWKYVTGFEGYYQVSNSGEVRSLDRTITKSNGVIETKKGKPIKIVYAGNMYGRVILYINGKGKAKLIHRLVAQAFIKNPENLTEVNHKDLDKTNNIVDNLEWVTPKVNTIHAFNNRDIKRYKGSDNHRAILSETQVIEIKELYATGTHTYKSIANLFNIGYNVVGYIIRGQTWSHLNE